MREETKLPSIGSVPHSQDTETRLFFLGIKACLESFLGRVGSDILEKAVTNRRLVQLGVIHEDALNTLEVKFDYNPASLADGAGVTVGPIALQGAKLGDFVKVSFSLDLQGIILTAWVSEDNYLKARFQNETTGTIDLAAGTIRLRLEKPLS